MREYKVIISNCYGGFEPNKEYQELLNKKGLSWWEIKARTDSEIIDFVEENIINQYGVAKIGIENYQCVSVAKVDISIPWTIEQYDGAESIQYIKYKVLDDAINYCEFEN